MAERTIQDIYDDLMALRMEVLPLWGQIRDHAQAEQYTEALLKAADGMERIADIIELVAEGFRLQHGIITEDVIDIVHDEAVARW